MWGQPYPGTRMVTLLSYCGEDCAADAIIEYYAAAPVLVAIAWYEHGASPSPL